jgi:Uncharacterised nucleotidyltransferase
VSNHATTTPSTGRLDTFRLDVKYTQVAAAFDVAGIETILLKGPAFDQLLFDGERSRAYSDIDLLVDPSRVLAAERLLEKLGFHRAKRAWAQLARRSGVAPQLVRPAHATAWVRDGDRFTVDLHATLPQAGATAPLMWHTLRAHRATITVAGTLVQTLDRPASALLIALHAAHHGPDWNRTRTDLQRACERLEPACWQAALRLARELRAEAAMGIGLGTVEEGHAVARELGLSTRPTLAYRLMWSWATWLGRGRAGWQAVRPGH